MKGRLFLIIGPSGVGKNTIIRKLLHFRKDVHFIASYSSRPIRPNETDGHPYYFVSNEDFERMIQANELLEWKVVHGCYYGISKTKIDMLLKEGKILITDIEVLGAMDVIEAFLLDCVSVYVDVLSKDQLIERIRDRGAFNQDDFEKRLKRVSLESRYKYHFDYSFCNVNLERSVEWLSSIIDLSLAVSSFSRTMSEDFVSSKPVHYVVNLFVVNENYELLLLRGKGGVCEYSSLCKLCFVHILANETPQEAVFRFLEIMNVSLKASAEDLICLGFRNEDLEMHRHYVMVYKLHVNNSCVSFGECDEYLCEWFSRDKLAGVLSEQDLQVVRECMGD